MPMPLKVASVAKATKLISEHVDSVTCLECCKYYRAPERAACGHTLCHTCWRGRRACPACAVSLDRRALKLDIPLQSLTEHVRQLVEAFEQFVGVKMDEFMMDMPLEDKEPEMDPSKHVKEWLVNSDNHFSAPPYSDTQQSTQELPQQVLLSTSKLQIHSAENNKTSSPEKVIHVSVPQEDWDNIEVLPDTEDICGKRKASIAGPMDLEPFYIDDNEYSSENPRRSSRKRDTISKETGSPKKQIEKQASYNSSAENDKKLEKAKQNWAQVKKMKKEFGKLNKVNKNKLNISIEMCKKTQSGNSKQNSATPPITNGEEMIIDDNTPDILAIQQKDGQAKLSNKENISNNTQNTQNNINIDENVYTLPHVNRNMDNDLVNKKASQKNGEDSEQIPNTFTEEERQTQQDISKQTQETITEDISEKENRTESAIKVPFFKTVHVQDPDKAETVKPVNINIPSNVPASDDDIHITIRIGDVVTNITINKKQNDVQLKVNSDREVQTSLGSVTPIKTNIVRPETKEMEVQTDFEENKAINSATQIIAKKGLTVLDKSVSTRKNTASAETATAHFEITESVEKELSKIMECQDESESHGLGETQKSSKTNKTVKKDTQTSVKSKKTSKNVTKSQVTENAISEDLELEDIDIFNSGSVKEQKLQMLHTTKSTPSEILRPTNKTNKTKTQKTIDKRLRGLDEDDEIETTNKRQKTISQDTRDDEMNNSIPLRDKPVENESTNYDEVMGQVFASIDADIQATQAQKSSKTKGNTQTIAPKTTPKDTEKMEVEASQIVPKPMSEKYSENIFSTVGNVLEKGNTHVPGPETQQNIDNLLTPGMCEDLASSQEKQHDSQADNEMVVMGTPMEEADSDKSIVEETPQKNKTSSPTKQKSKADSSDRTAVTVKSLQLLKPSNKKSEQKVTVALSKGKTLDSQDIGNIINLTDSVRESVKKNAKDSAARDPKHTLETPLTINRFVDQIKHKSTPVARKSLNFSKDSHIEDDDITLCPTDAAVAKTTQEKEFMADAFDNRTNDTRKPLATITDEPPYVIAGSCLTSAELTNLKVLCFKKKWTFMDKYTPDLTHLVVSVDEDSRAQRSVKYMCALAAGKLIVAYEWVKRCLESHRVESELPYEALDSTGDPGPRRSRTARTKVFHGITFHCMPPFSVLDVNTLESMLTAAGGRVLRDLKDAVAGPAAPSVVLAEPEHTQEDRFLYLAMQHGIVPVNYEWALNCLGSYMLLSMHDLLLCPAALLPKAVKEWPTELFSREEDVSLT